MALNQDQLAGAHAPHDAPLKIIAGAGTGKTETLAARFVALVQRGIDPARIVLLTFTEDAAAEMRARVLLRLREANLELPPHALLDLWIATFHGFAARLLRDHGFAIGLPPTPRLLNDDEQAEFWQTVRAALESEADLPPNYAPLDHQTYRWDNDETWNKVQNVVAALRRGGGDARDLEPRAELADQQMGEFAAHRAQLVPLIAHCYALYTQHLGRSGALDYDEQLRAALRLLRAKPELAALFDVVMIDEFQDTNRPQLDLLHELTTQFRATTVVGDPRQAIYGWNSARAESIKRFPFEAAVRGEYVPLTVNYRSHPAIVDVANLALAGSELGQEAPLQHGPPRSARISALANEPVVSLHLLPSVADEAVLVAAEIARLHENGVAYGGMAVLLRSRTYLNELTAAFRAAGVPFVLNGGTGFYLHEWVRLTAALLRVLHDPLDHAAWAHVLESPIIGLPGSVLVVRDQAEAVVDRVPLPWTHWLHDPDAVPADMPQREAIVGRLHEFNDWYEGARLRWGVVPPGALLEWLWETTGIAALANADQQGRLVLKQLLREADDYAAAFPSGGIAEFAALLRRRVAEQPRVALPTLPTDAAVEIATVHQAKGREWPVVFVYHTSLPSRRATQVESVLWDDQWNLVISSGATPRKGNTDPLHDLRADLRRRKRNEERSIWYVALTRAQERLVILHSGCQYVDHFADARAKRERLETQQPLTNDDENVHFFHELWEHLGEHAAAFGATVRCTNVGSSTDENG